MRRLRLLPGWAQRMEGRLRRDPVLRGFIRMSLWIPRPLRRARVVGLICITRIMVAVRARCAGGPQGRGLLRDCHLVVSGAPAGETQFAPAAQVVGRVLTPRQTDVLGLVAHGLSNRQVAAALGISVETAKEHVKDCYIRLGAKNRAHAVAIGLQKGLIRP